MCKSHPIKMEVSMFDNGKCQDLYGGGILSEEDKATT